MVLVFMLFLHHEMRSRVLLMQQKVNGKNDLLDGRGPRKKCYEGGGVLCVISQFRNDMPVSILKQFNLSSFVICHYSLGKHRQLTVEKT